MPTAGRNVSTNQSFPTPASYSPLSIQGHSINEGVLTCNDGQWSNISEVLRTQTQAKTLNNFQMLTRGIWSNPTGIGWQPQRTGTFNHGAAFMDFGVFEDFLGNQTMLFQVGDQVYSYDLTTSVETAYTAPLTALSTSLVNLPCMRSFVDNTGIAAPITVYCNGDIQPVEITGTAAGDVEFMPFLATGNSTTTPPNGGVFGENYSISTLSPGSMIASYPITASGTPYNCCAGPDGNLWYTDFTNSKIGKITPAGVVTEYATTTAASGPWGICVGPDGRLWFTEYNVSKIGAITTAGVITEYAASAANPTGICARGAMVNYITANDVWNVTTGGSLISYVAIGNGPWYGICLGPDGAIWIIGAGGAFGRVAGTTWTNYAANTRANTTGYSIVAGPDGRVWFADSGTNSIGASTTTGAVTYYNTPTANSAPWGIMLGSDNNLWFTEQTGNQIGRCTIAGVITEFGGLPAGSNLEGICSGPDGNAWFCEEGNTAIGTMVIDDANPRGVAAGPDGNLWFTLYATNSIGMLNYSTGKITTYPLPHVLAGPLDICSDGTNLWFTEYLGNRIGKITPAGVITEYSLGATASYPVGICLGPDTNLWFTESATSKIGKITPAGVITTYATTTGSARPWGICADATYLYVCESAANNIDRITTAGVQHEYAISTPSSDPLWIALGSDGRVWFTENAGNKIGAMTNAGVITEYVIPTSSSLPEQITAASDGNLYFVESAGNQIGQITTAGVIVEWPVDVNTSGPYGIIDGPDQSIWFTMNDASEIGNFMYGGSGTWPGVFQLTKKTYSKPKYCCYFNNRMAYFGFDSTTNAALDVLISNQGNASEFVNSTPIQATDAISFTIPGLGLPTGMAAFRLTNTNNQEVLLLGYQRGIAVVMGNGTSSDATTFKADILTYEYGLMSNRTFNQIQNDMYFLTTNGIRNFSNLTVNANLLNSNLTYQMQDVISSITTIPIATSNILYNSQAFAVHHRNTLEVQFWFPTTVDGVDDANFQNQHAIIMNYNTGNPVPQQLSPVFSTKNNTEVACGIEFNGVMYGGGYTGILQQHYDGNTYNGAPIQGTINLALINNGNVQQNVQLRQGIVVTEGAQQDFNVLTYFYSKQNDGTLIRTPSPEEMQELKAGVQGLTILGDVPYTDWTLGYSSFPANHIKHLYFEATGEGPYVEFVLTTNGTNQALDFAGVAYTLTGGGMRP